jgi:hypothetical protein
MKFLARTLKKTMYVAETLGTFQREGVTRIADHPIFPSWSEHRDNHLPGIATGSGF